jgi:hypothetical protein
MRDAIMISLRGLLNSGGSDNLVNLWRIASCSSSPLVDDPDNANTSDEPIDSKVRSMDQHEDSVYALAWLENVFYSSVISHVVGL